MKNRKKTQQTFISIAVATVTVIALVIFFRTLVLAAVYDPGGVGTLPPMPGQTSGEVPSPLVASAGASQTASEPAAMPADYPERLLIPALNINAFVQDVGITARDNIGIPSNFTDVGWYSYAGVPGQNGVAVIDGHVDNGLSLAGVFKHLSDIQPGDDVYVVTYGGTRLHFVVATVEAYDYQNIPEKVIFGSDASSSASMGGAAEGGTGVYDGSILRLITCTGDWVPDGNTYNERLVVTTDLVQS